MRVMQGRYLHAVVIDQFGTLIQPAILLRLAVQKSPGIRRRQRDLDRMRIDLLREIQRLLNRLLRFARKTKNESAVNDNAKIVAIPGELLRDLDPHPFLDVIQNLLIAGFISDEQQTQTIV